MLVQAIAGQASDTGRITSWSHGATDGRRSGVTAAAKTAPSSRGDQPEPAQTEEGMLVSSAIRDITERKRAAETLARQAQELARSNAELGQFAYVASHDLREPLRVIRSYIQILDDRCKGKLDPDCAEFMEFIVDGAVRMERLVEDLLSYARVTTEGKRFGFSGCPRGFRTRPDQLAGCSGE